MNITQANLKVAERKIEEIYYVNESELRCSFQREYNKSTNDFVDIVVCYDDFADQDNKWLFSEYHYNGNGDFIDVRNEQMLSNSERNEIKAFIIDWFNRNYDITQLLETDYYNEVLEDDNKDYWK